MSETEFRFDPNSYEGLEKLGRISLSKSFHMREFLYSETAVHYVQRNVPDNVAAAVLSGRQLCQKLLEPLQDAFGRIHIRSGFRSRKVNECGAANKRKCAIDNDGFHTWDYATNSGHGIGAVACVTIPTVSEKVLSGVASDLAIAWWIVDHLPDWSCIEFFATPPYADEVAFNIGWHQWPIREVSTWREGPGRRTKTIPPLDERKQLWTVLKMERGS